MTPLEERLRRAIAADGPMPVDRYMRICLTDPEHGYYTTRAPIGAAGDFTTAPEISQMFGEIIGAWLMTMFLGLGGPSGTRLVELGPGRGTLMADILRVFTLRPETLAAVEVVLVETSPTLRKAQQQALADWPGRKTWIDRLDDLDEGPMLLVANEFLDALPIRQLVHTEQGLRERCVGLSEAGELIFTTCGRGRANTHAEPLPAVGPLAPGDIVEIGDAAEAVTRLIAGRLSRHPGYALIVDYGYDAPAAGDTLQAMRGHGFVDPLDQPGMSDLTSHVCFGALRAAAEDAGALAHGPLTQAAFLTQLGISLRADRLIADAQPAHRAAIETDLARLISPDQMGALFKVMALRSPGLAVPPPFPSAASGGRMP